VRYRITVEGQEEAIIFYVPFSSLREESSDKLIVSKGWIAEAVCHGLIVGYTSFDSIKTKKAEKVSTFG